MIDADSVDPMPPVDGAALLDDIKKFLSRFVVYPGLHELHAHVLWIGHCWFMEKWESTPRISFLSPEPASGKSRALEVTEPLVPRPVHAVNTTPAYLFRKVSDATGPPTILYDEVDTLFGPKAKEHEEVRGMINAGHRRGATAGRCVVRGKIVETEELPAYCAVALAGLDDLPDTIMTRSVVVRMRRRAADERVQAWRRRLTKDDAEALTDRLRNWCSTADPLENGWPTMPDCVEDRDADVWEALLAVADLAGGHWPETARDAASALVAASRQRQPSIGVLLLRDIKKVFDLRPLSAKLLTEDIIRALVNIDESPWGSIRKGEPIDARSLASRLRKYGISSKPQRTGEEVFKGYSRAQFEDAWKRYVDELDDDDNTQPKGWNSSDHDDHDDDDSPMGGDSSVTSVTDDTDDARVTDVTARKGASGDDLFGTDWTVPDGSPNGNRHHAPSCECGNALTSPEAIRAGRCKPCRDEMMAGYDQ